MQTKFQGFPERSCKNGAQTNGRSGGFFSIRLYLRAYLKNSLFSRPQPLTACKSCLFFPHENNFSIHFPLQKRLAKVQCSGKHPEPDLSALSRMQFYLVYPLYKGGGGGGGACNMHALVRSSHTSQPQSFVLDYKSPFRNAMKGPDVPLNASLRAATDP